MNADKLTTIAGLILGGLQSANVISQPQADVISKVFGFLLAAALVVLGYYAKKPCAPGVPPPPPEMTDSSADKAQ